MLRLGMLASALPPPDHQIELQPLNHPLVALVDFEIAAHFEATDLPRHWVSLLTVCRQSEDCFDRHRLAFLRAAMNQPIVPEISAVKSSQIVAVPEFARGVPDFRNDAPDADHCAVFLSIQYDVPVRLAELPLDHLAASCVAAEVAEVAREDHCDAAESHWRRPPNLRCRKPCCPVNRLHRQIQPAETYQYHQTGGAGSETELASAALEECRARKALQPPLSLQPIPMDPVR